MATLTADDASTLYTVSELEEHYGRDAVVRVKDDDPVVEVELAALTRRRHNPWLLLVLSVTTAAAVLLGYGWSRHHSERALAAAAASCPTPPEPAAKSRTPPGEPTQAAASMLAPGAPTAAAAVAAAAGPDASVATRAPVARVVHQQAAASPSVTCDAGPTACTSGDKPTAARTGAASYAGARARERAAATEAALKHDLDDLARSRSSKATAPDESDDPYSTVDDVGP